MAKESLKYYPILLEKNEKVRGYQELRKTDVFWSDDYTLDVEYQIWDNTIRIYISEFTRSGVVGRDYFRREYPSQYRNLLILFKTFSEAKKALRIFCEDLDKDSKDKTGIHRDDFELKKEPKSFKFKSYVVTSYISGTEINEAAIASIQNYCKINNAELVLLLGIGSSPKDEVSNDIFSRFTTNLVTEFKFNNRIIAKDFKLLPQMIIPTTGLQRFGQKEYSVLVASPKQMMSSVPRGRGKHPHLVWSTGTISEPNYANNRRGQIAIQDHTFGAIIVDVESPEIFYPRNIVIDEDGGFNDQHMYYTANSCVEQNAVVLSLGDSHYGIEDKVAEEASKEIARLCKPTYILFNDLCDNRSITHHEKHNILARCKRSKVQKTLESELTHLGKCMQPWVNEFKDSALVVIPSNHDDFIPKWLIDGEFIKDEYNVRLGIELLIAMLDGFNPMEYFLKTRANIDSIKFLKLEDGFNIDGVELNSHGHIGTGGAKGSARSLENAFGKCTSAHTHAPTVFRGVYTVGTNSILNPDYAAGGGSSWLHADVLQFQNGTRQMIIKINGKFKLKNTKK
jgi:hypothetical protein